MRRHRPAQVILPMLILPLLLASLAMLLLPEPGTAATRYDAPRSHGAYFTLLPRSLMP